ncbi:protein dopey-1 homolog isoform X3 [Photinus pyralis]|uniref:protein dopey-1 homolog isoform X3 n=2 Tax=Photinus pyralis TaxID=7054 RepID=UPI001267343E|nr:protein dopey-1 homolog isoform X3 [Photinus pyralis]
MEEYELMKDSKYRMYVAAVDKALKNFESTFEWADLISSLGKLNKVLLSYTKFPVIPRRIKISKRLAQCMHPNLPSGVHLRALETYDIIFKCMGTNRLSHELFIYSAGLFPLLGNAAMTVRPILLQLYETHFVPLRARLRPALSGFLSGVLPGLETGSDHFDRTNALLEAVCDGVGPAWFYTCIWQCVKSNGPIRLPAITYVLSHYSRKISMEDQLFLIGNDIDIMVSGLCAGVQDSSILVQRSALDLLMVCFPMHNTQLLYTDMIRLVTASLSTILRRDMSLNRRLYSWLLGAEVNVNLLHADHPLIKRINSLPESQSHTAAYFELYSYDILAEAIRVTLIQSSSEVPSDIKPYRLLTSLFDKPQIGPVIVDCVLFEVFRALYLTCLNQQRQKGSILRCVSFNGDISSLKTSDDALDKQFVRKNCSELIKNANLLFNTLESYYIWLYVGKLFEDAISLIKVKRKVVRDHCQVNEIGSGPPNLLEVCILAQFLLDIIHLETYTESSSEILPTLFTKVISTAHDNIALLNKYEIAKSMELCTKVLTKIQPVTANTLKNDYEQSIDTIDHTNKKYMVTLHPEAPDVESGIENKDIKVGLEKSKSDSKINETLNKNELTVDVGHRERSNSNQMIKKFRVSPKVEKKSKSKKSKSSSKLNDLSTTQQDVPHNTNDESKFLLEAHEHFSYNITRTENKHIVKCLKLYKQFYIQFLACKIMPGVNFDDFFSQLVQDKMKRVHDLENLLNKCLSSSNESEGQTCNLSKASPIVASDSKICEYESSMTLSSNILLEFSTFPNLVDHCDYEDKIPTWLKALIVCACFAQVSTEDIQIIAVNTLLELISLAKSQYIQSRQNGNDNKNINIVHMGLLNNGHVQFIEDATYIIEIMSQLLWDLIGTFRNQDKVMTCATLLYHIHNIFYTKSYVEDVIASYLVNDTLTVDFLKRFMLLWCSGRELDVKIPTNQNSIRNFDRSLLKVFDNFHHQQKHNLRLLSESFLTHCLLRNDIARIMNPFFNILLMPSTARISIRHINISKEDLNEAATSQKTANVDNWTKAYAISHINGEIKFHISEDSALKPIKRKSFLFSKAGKKSTNVIDMTTSITENSSVVTKKNEDFKNLENRKIADVDSKSSMQLFVNPLNSKEIYPYGITGSYSKFEISDDPNVAKPSSTESLSELTQNSGELLIKSLKYSNTLDRDSSCDLQNNSLPLYKSEGVEQSKVNNVQKHTADGISDKQTDLLKMRKSRSFDETNDKKLEDIENNLVHSWSYCLSDSERLNCEMELSTTAEEFFHGGDHAIISELVNDIITNVCLADGGVDEQTNVSGKQDAKHFSVYPIHYHVCLYYNVYDSNVILYALQTLKNCIETNPQLFVQCLATTGLQNLKHNDTLLLLARHRKSLLGGGFIGEVGQEHINFYRGYMFLDIVILICLNYAKTFYPHLESSHLTQEEIEKNLRVQLVSLEVLDIIIRSIINNVNENSKGFSSYIADMLMKCKLQEDLLHCLLTSVRNFDEDMSFAEEILQFNSFQLYDSHHRVSENVEVFQIQLLRLIQSLIILEHRVFPKQDTNNSTLQQTVPTSVGKQLTYTPTILIPEQQMFLSAIMSALRHQNMKYLHESWCNMVTTCLPYFGQNLKQITISIIHQLCNNIEKIADTYKNVELMGEFCVDYAITQINSLTILCHYCLVDSTQCSSQPGGSTPSTPIANPTEILNNLVSVFFTGTGEFNHANKQNSNFYQTARKTVLSHMPRIVSSIAKIWQTIISIEGEFSAVYGNSKIVKQQLLEFLSPISIHHGANFLAAIAVAWHERRNPFISLKAILPEANSAQNNLVYLISAIRVIPLDNLVQTVTAVIRNPPPIEGLNSEICLDVAVLELFYCYMRNASATQLSEAWSSLLTLVREGCSLGPPSQFLLAALLHELMIKCCPLEERKDQKDLQDVTARLIDCISQVCGSCLEQTTWLRRNLAVREQETDSSANVVNNMTNSDVLVTSNHSVQAQLVLSEILAPILDICFGSSEKDKVNPILTSLMYNIVPYLKTHTLRNMPSFLACSKLLASLSSYQYTRKAWKKDVFDLLLDNSLFQMDHSCLRYWKIIVDNLMTHDNTTFKDLMGRVSMTQTGSLNLFTSREQEYEQKAQLLKRLSFVIFCSEPDQYAKYMPDIQEQLNSSLRLNVPGIQAQVFLCFRVLLLRMTPVQVTLLWPIIISEMLQVFLQIEQELSTDTEEFSRNNNSSHIKLLTALDASWTTNSNNGLHALGHPHWLRLQLSTAKLLDLALLLPATSLPQFQMYRWAFVGDRLPHTTSLAAQEMPIFTPHVTRIANLMDQKFLDTPIETLPNKQDELLLTMNSIKQLKDLHCFFKTLSLCSNRHRAECNGFVSSDYNFHDKQMDKKFNVLLDKINKVIEMDFLDPIQR